MPVTNLFPLSSRFILHRLLYENGMVPLNPFPLPAGTMLNSVSRSHWTLMVPVCSLCRFLPCVLCLQHQVPKCMVISSTLWPASSPGTTLKLFPSRIPPQRPPCEQLSPTPWRVDFQQVSLIRHLSDFSTVQSTVAMALAMRSGSQLWGEPLPWVSSSALETAAVPYISYSCALLSSLRPF